MAADIPQCELIEYSTPPFNEALIDLDNAEASLLLAATAFQIAPTGTNKEAYRHFQDECKGAFTTFVKEATSPAKTSPKQIEDDIQAVTTTFEHTNRMRLRSFEALAPSGGFTEIRQRRRLTDEDIHRAWERSGYGQSLGAAVTLNYQIFLNEDSDKFISAIEGHHKRSRAVSAGLVLAGVALVGYQAKRFLSIAR